MLRLPNLEFHQPDSLQGVLELLQAHGGQARLLSGGTDVLPNLKLRQITAEHLISLQSLALDGIELTDNALVVGAATKLQDVADDEMVRKYLPALAFATSRIASPQIRRMGTIGGNLCLDTRCRYINQSELWREALGGCLKSHGSECHVVPGGQGCVAALSSDSVPPLIAYGATVQILGPSGQRSLAVADLYDTDGLQHVKIAKDEILLRIEVPLPQVTTRVVYRKWAVRKSIDFPLVSVAVRLDLTQDLQQLQDGLLVVGVLGPRPRALPLLKYAGRGVDEQLAIDLGDLAFSRCRPLPNVPYDTDYRRERLAIEVRRAVRDVIAAK